MMRMRIKEDSKLASIQRKYKKYCKVCGHTMTFFAFEPDKKLCSWCGYYNYRNGLVEFKEVLNKKRKELNYEKLSFAQYR